MADARELKSPENGLGESHILSVVAGRDIVSRELLTLFVGNVLQTPLAHWVILFLHPRRPWLLTSHRWDRVRHIVALPISTNFV